jgi:hypothetical protein
MVLGGNRPVTNSAPLRAATELQPRIAWKTYFSFPAASILYDWGSLKTFSLDTPRLHLRTRARKAFRLPHSGTLFVRQKTCNSLSVQLSMLSALLSWSLLLPEEALPDGRPLVVSIDIRIFPASDPSFHIIPVSSCGKPLIFAEFVYVLVVPKFNQREAFLFEFQ